MSSACALTGSEVQGCCYSNGVMTFNGDTHEFKVKCLADAVVLMDMTYASNCNAGHVPVII